MSFLQAIIDLSIELNKDIIENLEILNISLRL